MADSITFIPVIDAVLSTSYSSNEVTLSGVVGSESISITGGEYSVNSGAFTSSPGTVSDGDTVVVRLTSSSSNITEVVATLTIDSIDYTFSVTTITEVPSSNLIYLFMGTTSIKLPLATVDYYLEYYHSVTPNNECQILYKTVVSCYEWLIRNSASTSVSGSRREKKGRREIEVKDSNSSVDWTKALSRFLNNPWEAIPHCRTELQNTTETYLYIGGVSKIKVAEVVDNLDSNGPVVSIGMFNDLVENNDDE